MSISVKTYLLFHLSIMGLKKPIFKKKLPEAGAFVYLSITNQKVKFDLMATFFNRKLYIILNYFENL
jgi:hypothetical protein